MFQKNLPNYSRALPLAINSEEAESTHLQWLKNKVFKKEIISMRDFATTFEYLSENDADIAFKSLLSKSMVPQARRTAALNSYEIWKRNEGLSFWATQRAKLSLTQTADELITEGAHVARDLVRKSRISISSPERSAQTEETSQNQGSCSTQERTKGMLFMMFRQFPHMSLVQPHRPPIQPVFHEAKTFSNPRWRVTIGSPHFTDNKVCGSIDKGCLEIPWVLFVH